MLNRSSDHSKLPLLVFTLSREWWSGVDLKNSRTLPCHQTIIQPQNPSLWKTNTNLYARHRTPAFVRLWGKGWLFHRLSKPVAVFLYSFHVQYHSFKIKVSLHLTMVSKILGSWLSLPNFYTWSCSFRNYTYVEAPVSNMRCSFHLQQAFHGFIFGSYMYLQINNKYHICLVIATLWLNVSNLWDVHC